MRRRRRPLAGKPFNLLLLVATGFALFSVPVISGFGGLSLSAPPEPRLLLRNLAMALLTAFVAAALLVPVRATPRTKRASLGVMALLIALYPVAIPGTLKLHGGVASGYSLAAIALAASILRAPARVTELAAAATSAAAWIYGAVAMLLVGVTYTLHGAGMIDDHVYSAVTPAPERFVAGHAPPDIYHVVFDGLGRPDLLTARYGVETVAAMHRLRALGPEIRISRGIANYAQTSLSMASMLNMTYLDPLSRVMSGRYSAVPLLEAIQRSSVITTLASAGYTVSFIGSGYSATAAHRLASNCDCDYPAVSEFETFVLNRTPLVGLMPVSWMHAPHRNRARHVLGRLGRLEPSPGPRFLFAHVMVPHPPFVFDEVGADVTPRSPYSLNDGTLFRGTLREYEDGYSRQATFVLSQIPKIVQHLVESSRLAGREAVVIVHGDHGPRPGFDVMDASRTDPAEVFPVFLAIRWARTVPGRGVEVRSLVNVYRALFAEYFQSELAPLPDRAYLSSFATPYDFTDVTDLVMPPSPD